MLGLAVVFGVLPAQAQLISPGELAVVHRELEGIRNCTRCHTLGNKGIDNARCLDCHTPLKTRIDAERGWHATVTGQNCADCHKEHFGAAFDLTRFDTTRFDHTEVGFALTGAHRQTSCGSCHRPAHIFAEDVRAFKSIADALDRTYLGLDTRCLGCHEPDTPHDGQFADQECATCHDTGGWEEAVGFDHDEARFKLTGRHQQVDCQGCHTQETSPEGASFTRYEGLAFAACSSCHEDVHAGAFGTACQDCHAPSGWHQVKKLAERRFDHAATGFDLLGRHRGLDCMTCHTRPARDDAVIRIAFLKGTEQDTYPGIQVEHCLSCHIDYHEQTFTDTPGGTDCANCHTQEGWVPVMYDLERHNREAAFVLQGAHLATPCTACHRDEDAAPTFQLVDLACQTCHTSDSPHGDQFADPSTGTTSCAACHTSDGWALDASFDHAQTAFPLTGRHLDADCTACHTQRTPGDAASLIVYRGLAADCLSCHTDEDPHAGQFERQTCDTCHDTQAFQPLKAGFDHSRTRFPLEGAHVNATCGQCHREESIPSGDTFIRYRPLGLACRDCHSDG